LAAEVVEILVRQTLMGQLPLSKGCAMAGIPNGGQLVDAAVVALIKTLRAPAAGGLGIGNQGLSA
jgi:hypothetical protein